MAGGSFLIVIILLAIVRELYTCKSKRSTKNTLEQNAVSDVSFDIVHERNELVSKDMSPKRNVPNSSQCGGAQYFSTDNVLEIRHSRVSLDKEQPVIYSPVYSIVSQECEGPRSLSKFKHPSFSMTTKTNTQN